MPVKWRRGPRLINTFIAEIEESDADFRDISNAEQWDYYYISAIGLQNELEEHMTLYRDGDMFFFYSGTMEHGLLVESSADLTKRRDGGGTVYRRCVYERGPLADYFPSGIQNGWFM